MRTLTKYLLLQIPGWVLIALLAFGPGDRVGLPLWAAYALIMVWVVKDLLLYPLVRIAYQSDMRPGAVRLIGARGVAKDQLNPSGYVQVRGELWRAEAEPSAKPIAPQSPIEVRGARGLTLIVTRRSG